MYGGCIRRTCACTTCTTLCPSFTDFFPLLTGDLCPCTVQSHDVLLHIALIFFCFCLHLLCAYEENATQSVYDHIAFAGHGLCLTCSSNSSDLRFKLCSHTFSRGRGGSRKFLQNDTDMNCLTSTIPPWTYPAKFEFLTVL